jgi:hypothetical protein
MDKLRFLLGVNAVPDFVFGALFMLAPAETAAFLGKAPVDLMSVLGVVLILHGVHLAITARRKNISPGTIYYFSAGDILWVNLTLMLAASGTFVTTGPGIAAALGIALFLGAVGLMQIWTLKQARREPLAASDHLPLHWSTTKAIASSWLAMKTWVKIWLFGLNAVFLAGIAFWPEPLAKLALASYAASGPWLFAIMVAQRGLTRFLGLAHLVPWLPLLAYLLLRLSSDHLGPRLQPDSGALYAYALLLTGAVAICLAFDAFDVWRWLRGERFRLGSAAAALAGASKPACPEPPEAMTKPGNRSTDEAEFTP